MAAALVALFFSFLITLLRIRFRHLHEKISADSDLDGPQKFHLVAVPRIGGIAIFLSLLCAGSLRLITDWASGILLIGILACSLPAFLSGLFEDITNKISPKARLSACFISALLAYWILNTAISSIAIPSLDAILAIPLITVILSCVMLAGITNSYNIIDGFNNSISIIDHFRF